MTDAGRIEQMADEEPMQLESYQLVRCGGCDRFFAAEDIADVRSCPYCQSKVLAGSYNYYDISQQ